MYHATKYFNDVFPKYDTLNESVQENVVGIRVVKSFVREKYENVIKKYMGTAFTLAVKDQDFPMLQFICEHFSPDASALASAIDQCIEKEWGEGNAFLIEAKHKSFSKKTFDFDLDF